MEKKPVLLLAQSSMSVWFKESKDMHVNFVVSGSITIRLFACDGKKLAMTALNFFWKRMNFLSNSFCVMLMVQSMDWKL